MASIRHCRQHWGFAALALLTVSLLGVERLPAVASGDSLPDLTLELVAADGSHPRAGATELNLGELRGEVVYLDVWASWCAPCAESFPWLERLQRAHATDGLRVVAVSVDQDPAAMAAFLARHQVTFTLAHDRDHSIARTLAVPAMPTAFLIDREGVVRHVQQGFSADHARSLERRVEELLR